MTTKKTMTIKTTMTTTNDNGNDTENSFDNAIYWELRIMHESASIIDDKIRYVNMT